MPKRNATTPTTERQFLNNPVELARDNLDGAQNPLIQIFPNAGDITANDRRTFKLTDPQAVVDRFNANARPVLADYDHRSHFDPNDGGDQRAAGWIKKLIVQDNAVWGEVDWTDQARAAIKAGEYRYLSPEFTTAKGSNEVQDLLAVALVNRPAFNMAAVTAQQQSQTEQDMFINIAKALGLSDGADEAAILAAITKNGEDHKIELAAATQMAVTPSTDKFMPRADYDVVLARAKTAEDKVAEIETASFTSDVETSLAKAVSDGKITPASKTHYAALCTNKTELDKVLVAIDGSPVVISKTGLDKKEPGTETNLTAEEADMAASLGVSEKDFAAQKAKDANT